MHNEMQTGNPMMSNTGCAKLITQLALGQVLMLSSGNANPSCNSGFQTHIYNTSRLRCYSYNYEGQCLKSQCQYSHACLYCNGGHPLQDCQNKCGPAGTYPRFPNATRQFPSHRLINNNFVFRQKLSHRSRAPVTVVGPWAHTNTY